MSTQTVAGRPFGKTSVTGRMLLKLPVSRKKLDKKSYYMILIVNERSVRIQNKSLITLSVHPEIVDFGSRQGRRIFLTAGVVLLRRGSKISENAVLGLKMLFLDGH